MITKLVNIETIELFHLQNQMKSILFMYNVCPEPFSYMEMNYLVLNPKRDK